MEKKLLTADEILGIVDDLPCEELFIPEWKGWVRLRTLTAYERDSFEQAIIKARNANGHMTNVRAKLAAEVLVDDDGKKLYSPADVVALGSRSAKPMDRIFAKAQEMNGMSDKDVSDLEGNSEATPEPGST